jgi:four helix bundle protein
MHPEERSDLWGVCHELAVAVHRVTREWPAAEMYGLAGQARRAAVAAAINVADDPPLADAVRRRRISRVRGALHFLGYVLVLAHELGYFPHDDWQVVDRLRRRAVALTPAADGGERLPP